MERRLFAINLVILLLTACTSKNEPTSTVAAQPKPSTVPFSGTSPNPIEPEQVSTYTTQNDPTGNHLAGGSDDLLNAHVLDIPLEGNPFWLVSAPFRGDAVVAAVMDDGKVQAFKISGQTYEPFEITPNQLPAGMPPALAVSETNIQLIAPPDDASPLSNPLILQDKLFYIGMNGDLILNDSASRTRLPINALTDGRILVDENNRLLILTQPTNRYDHGILGDGLEASGITLIETEPELRVIITIPIEPPDVIEGLSPIWADIDNDGLRDVVITLSNNQSGSRIAAYREDGILLAESLPIGLGHRWRHQIAVAEFEANMPPLLADVRTPHIGGIVEFLQYNNGKLDIVKEIRGFSSHSIGSRNLDSAIAGDFNNDGNAELLVPDQPHANLGIISIEGVMGSLPFDGVLTSNLSGTVIDGRIIVGAGVQDKLRIWIP